MYNGYFQVRLGPVGLGGLGGLGPLLDPHGPLPDPLTAWLWNVEQHEKFQVREIDVVSYLWKRVRRWLT